MNRYLGDLILKGLQLSPTTVATYLEILEALFIVFTIRPWHKNIARGLLKTPKVYFYDTGLVRGDAGVRLENAMATMLQKHVHFLQDRWLYIINGGQRYSLNLFLRRNIFNGDHTDVPHRFYPRTAWISH